MKSRPGLVLLDSSFTEAHKAGDEENRKTKSAGGNKNPVREERDQQGTRTAQDVKQNFSL
jgi:hypothetical protein